MKTRQLIAASVAVAFALPLAAVAAGEKTTGDSGSAEKMFKSLDKDKDGYLSKEEIKGTQHEKEFATLDKNHDSKLSRQEYAAAAGGKTTGMGGTSGGSMSSGQSGYGGGSPSKAPSGSSSPSKGY